ncbi:nuclear transport factor 2 family protein [Longimicrobium sp.]|uniref:nuclear transport factor 2 family protein n=1 Tax=Longimicrobium sp. TaxID=2029185 RepID=UPI002F94F1BA
MNEESTLWRAARAALALCVVGACAAAPRAQPGREPADALRGMVQAERDFSARSAREGVRDAFLAFLADDGILFRPRPVDGKEFTRSRPSPPVTLTWRPARAAISCMGDLGFTSGPFVARPRDGGEVGHGYYFTIWRKQVDGSWKFVLDVGTTGSPSADSVPDWAPGGELACGTPGGSEDELRRADAGFADAWTHAGPASALAAWGDPRVWLARAGARPTEGVDAAAQVAGREPGRASWTPTAAHVSADGTLGYVYGAYTRSAPNGQHAGNYVRVWRRTAQGWRLLLDVVNARPTPAARAPTADPAPLLAREAGRR